MIVTSPATSAVKSAGATATQATKAGSAFAAQLATQQDAAATRHTAVRKMRPIMVPKAATRNDGGAAKQPGAMTALHTLQHYGGGTLATILARIRQV